MKSLPIAHLRLQSQQIAVHDFSSPKEIVKWMGALQAQDFAMSKWAVGCRLQNCSESDVNLAFDKAEIFRTHLMRPTWHLVAQDDIYRILKLTGPRLKSLLQRRYSEFGMDADYIKKAFKFFEKTLANGNHLTREELVKSLNENKISVDSHRAVLLLMTAEQDMLICSGICKGKESSYALFDERVKVKTEFKKEEALVKLAAAYFESHGPATIQDFCRWSALPLTEARMGVEEIKNEFMSAEINGEKYFWKERNEIPKPSSSEVFLLPAFDEYIISYKKRIHVIADDHHKIAVSSNGIFRPVLVVNGQVTGIWKRIIKNQTIKIESEFFSPPTKEIVRKINNKIEKYSEFVELKLI